MISFGARRAERIESDELALIAAGYTGRSAHALATMNWWVVPFTIVVAVATLVWVGVHLWPDLDADRWQAWADENPAFFAPLDVGSTIAIVPELHSHAGLLVKKTPVGIEVERHLWFPFDDVPVGLIIAPEVADQVSHLQYGEENFWSQWDALAVEHRISVYQHLRQGAESADGYDAFLARFLRSHSR